MSETTRAEAEELVQQYFAAEKALRSLLLRNPARTRDTREEWTKALRQAGAALTNLSPRLAEAVNTRRIALMSAAKAQAAIQRELDFLVTIPDEAIASTADGCATCWPRDCEGPPYQAPCLRVGTESEIPATLKVATDPFGTPIHHPRSSGDLT